MITRHSELPNSEYSTKVTLKGYVVSPARYDAVKKRSHLTITLSERQVPIHVFLHRHANQLPGSWKSKGACIALVGTVTTHPNGHVVLFDPTPIDTSVAGAALGVYPSKTGVIGADKVRERVLSLLTEDNLKLARAFILERIGNVDQMALLAAWGEYSGVANMKQTTLENVVYRMHLPTKPTQGEMAVRLLTDLDAFSALQAVEAERPKSGIFQQVVIPWSAVEARIAQMPYPPTSEQKDAVADFLHDMAQGKPAHRLLSGDVGTGKSVVMLLVMAAVYDAGGDVGMMLPSSDISDQFIEAIREWWPDIVFDEVTAKSAGETPSASVRIGTTALIHRCPDWKPTLTIVDEQQRMSVNQRHALTHRTGHLLEATATCLPRTLAQAMFGLLPVSRLTKPHTPKSIITTLHDIQSVHEKRALFQSVKRTLDNGDQVLVIYAARNEREADRLLERDQKMVLDGERVPPSVPSLESGAKLWRSAFGDDAVVTLHGKMKARDREASLTAMRAGSASILCATTAAEVGLNIPNLRRVLILSPERLGLTQLHQIRGRVARLGGDGWCDLVAEVANLQDVSINRLNALCATNDGFELAEADMRQRGLGDLSVNNNQQSGSLAGGVILNSKLGLEHFERATQIFTALFPKDMPLEALKKAS
ncbi:MULTISPECIES: helicase-related protein [Halomonadaceae]|uniref:helicase-related protein n=1 Tax=Halomonadaceae TaxID=28256 RepID=UPI0018682C79